MQGRHVFMGYLNNAEKNAEAFDEDGWLRTGDIGKRDQDNFLFITGRKKGDYYYTTFPEIDHNYMCLEHLPLSIGLYPFLERISQIVSCRIT